MTESMGESGGTSGDGSAPSGDGGQAGGPGAAPQGDGFDAGRAARTVGMGEVSEEPDEAGPGVDDAVDAAEDAKDA
jgi:hypothetical protein